MVPVAVEAIYKLQEKKRLLENKIILIMVE